MNILSPLLLSLEVAAIATLCTFCLGLGLARLSTRVRRGAPVRRKLWDVFECIILMPMVFPPTITGYLLLLLLGSRGPFGPLLSALGIEILFTWAAAVIAAVVVSLPLMYQACKGALLSVEPQYAAAARTLGLSERRIFWRVTFPLAWPGVLGGIALAFARALGEFGATLMIAGNIPQYTQTLPLALYSAVESGRQETANVILGIMLIFSFAIVFIVRRSERQVQMRRLARSGGAP
jgi:molybdate transport system permease protein